MPDYSLLCSNMTINQKVQFTSAGFADLKSELQQLIDTKRPAAIERVARARDFGDLSENAEYHAAREELSFLEGRINELQDLVKKASIVQPKANNGKINVGSKVTVSIAGNDHIYELVGEWEADPVKKKISHTSPLGQALIGKAKGDDVEFEAPAGKVVYKVKKIH